MILVTIVGYDRKLLIANILLPFTIDKLNEFANFN